MPNPTIGEPVARCALAVPVTYSRPLVRSTNPDDLLAELLDDLIHKRPVNAVSAWWLERGILRCIRRDQSLDESLGLSGPGRDTLHRRLMMVHRDHYLALAVHATALDEAVSTWERCKRLADQIKLFNQHTWPKTKYLASPLEDWPVFKKCLWSAAASDIALPESAYSLRRIVERKHDFSCNTRGAKLLSQFL